MALKLFRELGTGAPRPSWITSVYFDRADCPLAKRAVRSPEDCLKIRTKEYYPDHSGGASDRVVFEMKRERNGLTRKQRLWLPRAELAQTLSSGALGRKATRLAGGPVVPVLAVTYERQVFQRDDAWRVTMDRDVRYYDVSTAAALQATRLSPKGLGEPTAREMRVVVELKHLGAALPGWLVEVSSAQVTRYSKFAHGMGKVSAAQLGSVQGG